MGLHMGRSALYLHLLIASVAAAPAPPSSATAEPPGLTIAQARDDAATPRRQDKMNPEMQSTVETAFANAAKRTGIARSALVLVSAEAVTWPDGSLGCTRPGRTYAQAQIPGYRIRIQAGAKMLDYHANAHAYMILCPAWRPRSDPRN